MIKGEWITQREGGVRLDAALVAAFPSTTRAFVREAVAKGDVLVDSRLASKGLKLFGGERIFVKELAESADNIVAPNHDVPLNVVYEDDAIIACDKPCGIATHPLSRSELLTLANALVARFPECAALGDRPLMAGALHRLDADTSGLVIFARTQDAFAHLRAEFAAHTVEKRYLALVEGRVDESLTIEGDLAHDPTLQYCRMIDPAKSRLSFSERAKLKLYHAVTSFSPLGHTRVENEERTLLDVRIFTGVTHQIRAQLSSRQIHIVNDRIYGAFAVEDMRGHALHALSARFIHPKSGVETVVSTPLPSWALQWRSCFNCAL